MLVKARPEFSLEQQLPPLLVAQDRLTDDAAAAHADEQYFQIANDADALDLDAALHRLGCRDHFLAPAFGSVQISPFGGERFAWPQRAQESEIEAIAHDLVATPVNKPMQRIRHLAAPVHLHLPSSAFYRIHGSHPSARLRPLT